jgi:nucleoside-diphosphate-sugar epimerase
MQHSANHASVGKPAGAMEPGSRLPDRFESVEQLDDFLAAPSQALVEDLASLDGDILILGVAGKMGPTLARLARNAAPQKRVIGVARFSEPALRETLENWGIETITADLLDAGQVQALPKAKNVIFMAGRKFGSSGNQALTWAMNVHVPAIVAESFSDARIVAFSTGNIYPLVDVFSQGAAETAMTGARGEYAQSCLGRERMFEYFSGVHNTPCLLFRLNYAIDMRYGVLFDLASRVKAGTAIDLSLMGHVNVIWQGDANSLALRSLRHCGVPPKILNVSGPETLSVRWLCEELGARLGVKPRFVGDEAATAWLTNSAAATRLFGYPTVPLSAMLDWVGDWVARDMPCYDKPTKYEVRDGGF